MSDILNLDALCRCCHADGDFKSLQAPYVHDGAIEIYAVMLRDALGIHINPPTIEASYTICECCIDQLRLALKFKKQVLACEKKFEEYSKNEQTNHHTAIVKMEIQNDDNDSSPDVENDGNYDDDIDDSDGGYDEGKGNIKQEEETPSPCKFCKEMFPSSWSLRTHMVSHIADEDGVTCRFCNITFNKQKGLYTHLKKHEAVQCSFCTEVIISIEDLKIHERSHIELTGYVCDYCKMGFRRKQGLSTHLKTRHNEDNKNNTNKKSNNKFICNWCGHVLNSAYNLKQHVSAVHEKKRPFQCDQCKKNFGLKKTLQTHYMTQHTGERPFMCDICPRAYFNIGDLNVHKYKSHSYIGDKRIDEAYNNDDGGSDRDGGYDLNISSDKEMEGEKIEVEIKLEEETKSDQATKTDDVKIKECIEDGDDDDNDEDYANNDFSNENEDAIEDYKEKEEEIKPEEIISKPRKRTKRSDDKAMEEEIKPEEIKCKTIRKRKKRSDDKAMEEEIKPEEIKSKTISKRQKCSGKINRDTGLRISCDFCKEIFSSKPTLRSHVLAKHISQDAQDFPCPSCDITFNGRKSFIAHIKLKHERAKYHCSYCVDTFLTFKSLKTHEITHIKTGYICDYCQKGFKCKVTLRRHIRLHTGNYKEYVCETCGVVTKNATNLKVHIRSVHDKLRPFKCDLCPKTYSLKKHLKDHRNIHTGERPYECDVCFKRFHYTTSLHTHKLKHSPKSDGPSTMGLSKNQASSTDIRPDNLNSECRICGKRFRSKLVMKQHMNVHTKPFKCHVCGKGFGNKYLLIRHQKWHDTDKGRQENNTCKICNKNYYNWEIHKRIHDKKPFSCHICHKIYSEQKTLDWHMNVKHLKDRKHICRYCQKGFTIRDALKVHMLRKHDPSREKKKKERKNKKTKPQRSTVKVEAIESDFDSVLPVYAVNVNELGSNDYSSVTDNQDLLGI